MWVCECGVVGGVVAFKQARSCGFGLVGLEPLGEGLAAGDVGVVAEGSSPVPQELLVDSCEGGVALALGLLDAVLVVLVVLVLGGVVLVLRHCVVINIIQLNQYLWAGGQGGCQVRLAAAIFPRIKMIEKSRVYPEFQYGPSRFAIDHFHNPYLAKLNVKLTARTAVTTGQLLSPLSPNNNLYLSQAIPLHKNERFKLALLWRQYITHKYARAHFGFTADYRTDSALRLKLRALVGNTSLLDLEASRKLTDDLEGFAGYSGFLENNNLFSSVHVGGRWRMLSGFLTKRLGGQTEASVGVSRQVAPGLSVECSLDGNATEMQKGELSVMLRQQIDAKSWSALGVAGSPYYSEGSLKVEYERFLTKTQKLIVSSEYSEAKTIFYLGFKNLNFNFVFPIFAVDGPIPLLFASAAYALTYLYNRFAPRPHAQQVNNEQPKSIEARLEELQLIGEKAADHYERERGSGQGLRIEQAYIGPAGEVEEFMDNPQRFHLLIRSDEHREKFVDLTVTLRFYVSKGELKLRKGQKNALLGFYRHSHAHERIGVRYIKNGHPATVFFDYLDPIVIPAAP